MTERPNAINEVLKLNREIIFKRYSAIFENVFEKLKHEISVLRDPSQLGTLACDLIDFQRKWSNLVKIPKLYYFHKDTLGIIAKESLLFMVQNQWRALNFQDSARENDILELFSLIEERLLNADYLETPKVYLHQEVLQECQGMVEKLNGEIVAQESDANFMVMPKQNGIVEEKTHRILQVDEALQFGEVHWLRRPDMFDTWYPMSTLEKLKGKVDEFVPPCTIKLPKMVKVNTDFIKDSEKCKEWMNPYDYSIELPGLNRKRKPSMDKTKEEDGKRTKISKDISDQDAKRALKDIIDHKKQTSARRVKMAYTDLNTGNVVNQASLPQTSSSVAMKTKMAIPACSSWFRIDLINAIEKRMLPEFFVNANSSLSKTPQVYMQYRNFMINAYRQDPDTYLNATSCRRSLAGDACAILRVHEFLEHWGLINFQVPPHARPLLAAPMSQHFYTKSLGAGHIYPDNAKANLHKKPTGNTTSTKCQRLCSFCSSECSKINYQLTDEGKRKIGDTLVGDTIYARPGFCICEPCFRHGKFSPPNGPGNSPASSTEPTRLVATDFERKNYSNVADDKWSETEITTLLQTLAKSDGVFDWDLVAKAVGTKSRTQCVTYFLQASLDEKDDTPESNTTSTTHSPFGDLNNPALAQVSTLISQVHPQVAAAAAKAALLALQKYTEPLSTTMPTSATQSVGPTLNDNKTASKLSPEGVAESIFQSGIDSGVYDDPKKSKNQSETKQSYLPEQLLATMKQSSNATAIASLACSAKIEADRKLSNIQRLMEQLTKTKLQKMELTLRQVQLLQDSLVEEKEQLRADRYSFYLEKFKHVVRTDALKQEISSDAQVVTNQ